MTTSLIIPTKNREENIYHILSSLDNFGYLGMPDLEIIVVDSSKDDLTEVICKDFGVEVIKTIDLGKTKSMNYAINKINSDLIGFLDDDIRILNNTWLQYLISELNDETVAYVSGRVISVDNTHEAQLKWEKKGALNKGGRRIIADRKFFKKLRLKGVPVNLVTMGACHLVRTSVIKSIGLHDTRFGPGEAIPGAGADLDLTYKVLRGGFKVIYTPACTVGHVHPADYEELTRKMFEYGISDIAIHLKFLLEFKDARSFFQIFFRIGQNTLRFVKSFIGLYPLRPTAALNSIIGNFVGIIYYFKYYNSK